MNKKGNLVYNPNSFEMSGYVNTDNGVIYARNVPAMGWCVTDGEHTGSVTVGDRRIESDHYVIVFNESMNIISLEDRKWKRI